MDSSKPSVFISYAREDAQSARRLYRQLQQAGALPWLDEEDLLAGQDWLRTIKKAIAGSDYFIALLSSHSTTKQGVVQREMRLALDALLDQPPSKIFLIPVRLDECRPEHDELGKLHWVDLFPDWDTGLQKILKAIFQGKPPNRPAPQTAGRDLSRLDWKRLQPINFESFTVYEDTLEAKQRVLAGSLVIGQDGCWQGDIRDGVYRLDNQTDPSAIHYSYVGLRGEDLSESAVSIEVAVEAADQSHAGSGCGILYRFDRQRRFYYGFALHPDQSVTFYKRNASGWRTLRSIRSRSLHPEGLNKLALVSRGEAFFLYVNDQFAMQVNDAEISQGDPGLIALGTGRFSYDDFAIYKP